MSKNGNERRRILTLSVKNIKLIREVAIDMNGDIREFRGDSGQGKTTILESIEGAFRGLDPDMVTRGQNKGEIELRMSDATIKRIINADGTKDTVMVTDANGKAVDQAVSFLKTICGPTAFRPLSWVQLGAGDAKGRTERLRLQREQLLEAIPINLSAGQVYKAVKALGEDFEGAMGEIDLDGLDFDQHAFVVCSALERRIYDVRKEVNVEQKHAENQLALTPAPERPAPKADIDVCRARAAAATEAYHAAKGSMGSRENLMRQRDELAAKIAHENAELPEAQKILANVDGYEKRVAEGESKVAELEAALKTAKAELEDSRSKLVLAEQLKHRLDTNENRKKDLERIEAELAGEGKTFDLEALEEAMQEAQADAEARRLQDLHEAAAATAIEAKRRSDLFTGLIELFRDDLPKRLLEGANLPVDGLGIDEEKILIHGIPLHQMGTSQQISIGVRIASALNPRSGFVLVDGAESLGRGDRLALYEAAKELGLQLIMTVVDPDAEPSDGVVVMRGGEAVSAA